MSGFEENEVSRVSNGGTELSSRSLQSTLDKNLLEHFQIIPSRPRELKEDKIRILNLHDLALDPEVEKLKYESERNNFHKFVFVSNWQMNEFHNRLSMPFDEKMQVIENPIEPFEYAPKDFEDKVQILYFSTPQRGLEILYPVFDKLTEKHPNIHLNVFSSFNIYGWEEMDKKFEPLYEKLTNHPNISYNGFVEYETLRKCISEAHILAYPCTWQETSCRVLIESMSAGLLCVHPNLAALPETSGGLTMQYQFQQDPNVHANIFYNHLDHAINVIQKEEMQNYLKYVKSYADTKYSLNKIVAQWHSILNELLKRNKNVDSRKIKPVSQMFRYNVQ